MMRSGYTAVSVPTTLKQNWQKKLGGRLSSVTVADDKVFVARVDAGILVALDRHSGQTRWTFTADGRIDSPPTIWQGRVFFGGTDGYVYCLCADSGELAWRFLAAPVKQSIISQERPESVWPVHGSVLIDDGQVYFTAGRSSFLDGGMVLYRLDGNTGAVVEKTVLNDLNYNGTDVNQANAPGRLPDILSSDGQSIFMRHSRFDMNCQPRTPDVPHLFSAAGFLDGSWWHRTYWLYGDNNWSGYGGWYRAYIRTPTGRIMVFDDQNIYGFGRNRLSRTGAHPGIDGKNLFYYNSPADPHNPDYRFAHYKLYSMQRTFTPPDSLSQLKWYQSIPSRNTFWSQNIPIWAFGLVMTDETLFMAGPPDIMKTEDPADALQGKSGGRLLAVSTPEGEILADCPIQSIPTWDGMAAAYGCLFYSTLDGKVVCMGE
jgi:hypothetical protein